MRPTAGPLITREGVELALRTGKPTTLKARAEALELQADQCDYMYPWPALSASLRSDAQLLRRKHEQVAIRPR